MLSTRISGTVFTVAPVVSTVVFTEVAPAATINVPGDLPTIQAGIDAAVDEVLVADGTYNEIIDLLGKAITVRSANGAAVTTIDATGVPDPGDGLPVVRCDSGEGADTVLDGFTITGGTGDTSLFATTVGGGMFINNASSPMVTNCTFSGNSASAPGGSGSGMYIDNASSPTVTNCTFTGNTSGSTGGGIGINNGSRPTITNCVFSGNNAFNSGGGIVAANSSRPKITNCTFSGNSANASGGGIFISGFTNMTMTNCIFWENVDDADGSAGGPFTDESAQIHSAGVSTPIVSNSDVQGGWTGLGSNNINADPSFVNVAGGDFHLSASSLCIDAGISLLGIPETDLDGNIRPVDDPATVDTGLGVGVPVADMGAYEFRFGDSDIDGDGDTDPNDFLTFSNCFNGSNNPPACP